MRRSPPGRGKASGTATVAGSPGPGNAVVNRGPAPHEPRNARAAPRLRHDPEKPAPGEEEPAHGRARGVPELEGLLRALLAPPWRSAAERARALLAAFPLPELARASAELLVAAGHLAPAQARRVWAAFEIGRSVERDVAPSRACLRSPERVFRLMQPELRGLEQEVFYALALDARHRLRQRVRVSSGTLTGSLVHPREVFREAIRFGAAALVVVHNHPSGDPEPSAEDQALTRRLVEAGKLLGIPLLDHVVIGADRWVSLRERMGLA